MLMVENENGRNKKNPSKLQQTHFKSDCRRPLYNLLLRIHLATRKWRAASARRSLIQLNIGGRKDVSQRNTSNKTTRLGRISNKTASTRNIGHQK
jgi:hypothetical protein